MRINSPSIGWVSPALFTVPILLFLFRNWSPELWVKLLSVYAITSVVTFIGLNMERFDEHGDYYDSKEIYLGFLWPIFFVIYLPEYIKIAFRKRE